MKIALVLYGQPREYERGHATISAYLKDADVDVFYHCWTLKESETFAAAPWRFIDPATLQYTSSSPDRLRELYRPIAYAYELQTDEVLAGAAYTDTLAYANTVGQKRDNCRNVMFQMYSRTKARHLVAAYVASSGTRYDAVLTTRFDIGQMPTTPLERLDLTKTYVSDLHRPRHILPDNCILAPLQVYLDWFTVYDDLPVRFNDRALARDVQSLGERFEINPEEVLFMQYIARFGTLRAIRTFSGGTMVNQRRPTGGLFRLLSGGARSIGEMRP